jgi:murein DD-endopeptidase MepM/ murein hydrolase activator NlpD
MLFVDPAPIAEARIATAPASSPVARKPVAERRSTRPAVAATTPIGPASRYQVQPGDTVSSIVLRVANRTMSLWPAVNAIFAANPDAFIDNDPNRLKAGSWLSIPSLDGTAPVVAEVADAAATAEMPAQSEADRASAVYEPVAAITPVVVTVKAREASAVTVMEDTTADLRPGDVVYDYERAGPAATTASAPVVTTSVISTGARSESTSLFAWLVGGGLAILGGLALFGRRLRGGDTTTEPLAAPAAATQPEPAYDVVEEFADYDIEDDSPTEENLALDADLEIGSGFDTGVDVEVAEDFAFAATTELDIELPFEPETTADGGTDILPPVHMNVESILESEVLPEDDDYDMSVIVDATKMPQPEDATEHDLKAVEVAADDGTLISDNYTISREVDYDILEQDYEDELSATQALNQEIERAAAELARDLEEDADDEATAELDASYDPNDTNAVTVNMSHDVKTSEMQVANDDETVEMDVAGGKA